MTLAKSGALEPGEFSQGMCVKWKDSGHLENRSYGSIKKGGGSVERSSDDEIRLLNEPFDNA